AKRFSNRTLKGESFSTKRKQGSLEAEIGVRSMEANERVNEKYTNKKCGAGEQVQRASSAPVTLKTTTSLSSSLLFPPLQQNPSPSSPAVALTPLPSLPLCGCSNEFLIVAGGRVLTWGRGTSGQLGHGDMVNSLNPKPVDALQSFVITHGSAGWNHSGFVSDTGCLFTCGDGSFGQLGHGDYSSRCSPVNVLYFSSRHVEQIVCGMRHSLALLKGNVEDHVYGFGSGKRGQLGTSRDRIQSISLPQITLGLEDNKIASISANGIIVQHYLVRPKDFYQFDINSLPLYASALLISDGHLYIWGRGFGSTTDVYCPHRASVSLTFTQAALGWNHALLLTGDGTVFMLGGNHHGGLSNPQKTILVKHTAEQSNEALVGRIPNLDGIKVLQVAAGAEHSALVTGKNGVIMTWGWGEHGQLGLGNSDDQTSPQ
ncbi:hypothetical protein RJ639_046455, partial [Escallonia herrerae]